MYQSFSRLMSLTLGYPLYAVIPAVLVAGLLAYWVYRFTVPRLSLSARSGLGFLRFLSLALILFLLAEPLLSALQQEEKPPLLAVMVDNSQSLGLSGDRDDGTSFDLGQSVIQTMGSVDPSSIPGETRFFTFNQSISAFNQRDTLSFDGERTNIAQALEEVLGQLENDNLQAVLVVSDGQYNTGRNPVYIAERYPVPIHTVVVGDTTRRRDVRIRNVNTNEIAYLNEALPFEVNIRAEGYDQQDITVTLFDGDEAVDTRRVSLPAGQAETTVSLTHTPETEGLRQMRVSLSRLEGELTYRNNIETVPIQVLENKKQFVLFAAAPEPDLAALLQMLSENPDYEVSAYVQKNSTTFYQGAPPSDLSTFDAIILAGFPGREANRAQLQAIRQAMEEGTPALFLYSRHTDLAAYQRHFEGVLPAWPGALRTTMVEANPILTPEGSRHPVLAFPPEVASATQQLPPLTFNDSRWQTTPDARILAGVQVRGIALEDPILAIQQRNRWRSAVFLGANTWRWKNLPRDLQSAAPYWPTLVSNLLQWITTREDTRPVRVSPVSTMFTGGDPVNFNGQVYDESLNPVDGALMEIEIQSEDGTAYPYQMEPIGNGRYQLAAGSLPEGSYQYTARATVNGTQAGTDQGTFAVGALTLEFKEITANTEVLRQIAQRSGGNFLPADRLNDLQTQLANQEGFASVFIENREEIELWRNMGFLIAILTLLTLEWFFRKRSGMV